MASEYGYRFTQKAIEDFDAIISYIAVELDNPKAAAGFADEVAERIKDARTFPDMGAPVVNEYLPINNVKKLIVGNYIIFYYPDDKDKLIIVLRIVYGKRSMDEITKELEI